MISQQLNSLATRTSYTSLGSSAARVEASGALTQVDEPPLATCRICLEDSQEGDLEVPCNCCGSVKFAHRQCVQKWINEKGNMICELCGQQFRGGYTVPPPRPTNVRRAQVLQGLLLSTDPETGLLVAQARRVPQDASMADRRAHAGATWCVTAVLILVGLLLLRHLMELVPAEGQGSRISYHDEGDSKNGMGSLDETGITILLLWLFIRLLLFALPMYAVLRMMTTARLAQQRAAEEEAAQRELYLLWTLESGLPTSGARSRNENTAPAEAAQSGRSEQG